MSLRPYQNRDVERIIQAVRAHRSVCYQLPTGGGKTVIAAELVRRLTAKGQKGLALVHRRELVRQFVATLRESDVLPHSQIGVIAAGEPAAPWAIFQIASVQTLVRRTELELSPRLIVVDEAHHIRAATWEILMRRWPNARILGLTATPARLDGKGLGAHFDVLLEGPSIQELVEQAYLAPTRVLSLPMGLNLEGVKTLAGDYNKGQVAARVTGKTIASVVNSHARYAKGLKTLFFGVTVKHSQDTAEAFRARGINAVHVDGTFPARTRDQIMYDFANGNIEVLCNCQLFDEGVDVPACACIILGAPTKSLTRYLQSCGRAMRPQPGKEALILDVAGVSHHLGLPDEKRHWTLDGVDQVAQDKAKPTARTRTCEQCHTVYSPVYPQCPHCGFAYDTGAPEEVDVELVDASTQTPVKGKSKRARVPRQKLKAMIRETGGDLEHLIALGQLLGYRPNWAYIQHTLWIRNQRRRRSA